MTIVPFVDHTAAMSTRRPPLRIEQLDPQVVAILRTKSPIERCQMAFESNRLVRERLRAHLRYEHPDWDDSQLAAEVARRVLWTKPMS